MNRRNQYFCVVLFLLPLFFGGASLLLGKRVIKQYVECENVARRGSITKHEECAHVQNFQNIGLLH